MIRKKKFLAIQKKKKHIYTCIVIQRNILQFTCAYKMFIYAYEWLFLFFFLYIFIFTYIFYMCKHLLKQLILKIL